MTKRIFRSICFVAVTVFIASFVLIMGILYGYFSDVQQNQLKTQTTLAAQGVSHEGIDFFDQLEVHNFRITWIDADGKVLYDTMSDTSQMENHMEREEIKEAFLQGYGESRRYSATLMERLLYCAQRLEDGTVIRFSVTQYTVLMLILGMAQPICIIFLAAVILSVVLAVKLSHKIVRPLNELNLDEPLDNMEYDELSPLLRRIDNQQTQLKWQEEQLLRKQKELDAIVGNMKEGMILLNHKGKIISINSSAEKLLNTNNYCVGKDILTISRNLELHEVLIRALEGERAERTVVLNGGSYKVNADPIVSEVSISGIAVLLFDVTEKEKAEQMRREFTANVSHELKTPLHVISGYAELLKNGMVESEDTIPFATKIYAEAQRMVQLVEDIISLSHLDEGADDMAYEEVDLYALAGQAVLSLESEAQSENISVELSGRAAVMKGIPHLLYSIIYNLCDNAIKYNHKGGSVAVVVNCDEASAWVSVKDTGIGIEPEHQERIFERFYRVDKSHSKEVGGTGLGLSIVKHAVKIHHAKIDLYSAKDEGTTITIKFPRY
ncbi:MAG: PAS domain-containing sensor histidine kinase [Lachnospiraceae bacterium]|nr:PAS domain-containing sensor histidine kinase [Lachnospiraceae bacterium]